MLAVNHHFILEFERLTGAGAHLGDQVTRIADALHADPTVIDASVGADLTTGRVEFEVGADAADVATALEVVWQAVTGAIQATGGHVVETLYPHEPPPVNAGETTNMWRQRRTELADA